MLMNQYRYIVLTGSAYETKLFHILVASFEIFHYSTDLLL